MMNWTPPGPVGDAHRPGPIALAVSRRGTPRRLIFDAECGAWLLLSGFDELDGALLARHRPAVVISRVLDRGFDALDLARRLAELRYPGRFVALADALPRPWLVRCEVVRACPGLRFEVVPTRSAAAALARAV